MDRSERIATNVRYVLFAGIALVLGLLLFNGGSSIELNPLRVRTAHADGVAAAPGYLALTTNVGVNDKFYIIDSNRQVICGYTMNGDKIRLVSVRSFTSDMNIFDSSVDVPGPNNKQIQSFEGKDGIDATTAQQYAEGLQKLQEAADKSR